MDIFEKLYGMPQEDVTIEEQLSVLEGLGITCPLEEQLEEIRSWIGEEEYSFLEEAGNTYVTVLEVIGGEESESDTVYSFDSEVLDAETMYTDFMEHIMMLAHDDFQLTDIEEIIDDEEEVHTITFKYNGHPYTFEGEEQGDWMDCSIIDFMNNIFEKEDNEKRLLCMVNNSQGFIVMYNTIEWAKEFAQKTARPLSTSYELNDLILPE